MAICFTGEVEVEEDAPMMFNRFIVRENEIPFEIDGKDVGGAFKGNGKLILNDYGKYRGEIEYYYPMFHVNNRPGGTKPCPATATLIIDSISINKKKSKCKVRGKWLDGPVEKWAFSGTLKKYQQK